MTSSVPFAHIHAHMPENEYHLLCLAHSAIEMTFQRIVVGIVLYDEKGFSLVATPGHNAECLEFVQAHIDPAVSTRVETDA